MTRATVERNNGASAIVGVGAEERRGNATVLMVARNRDRVGYAANANSALTGPKYRMA